jgi:hypothetical protein
MDLPSKVGLAVFRVLQTQFFSMAGVKRRSLENL